MNYQHCIYYIIYLYNIIESMTIKYYKRVIIPFRRKIVQMNHQKIHLLNQQQQQHQIIITNNKMRKLLD